VDDGERPRLRGTAPTRFPSFPCGRHRCAHTVLRRTPLTGTKSQSQRNPRAETRSEPVPFLPLLSPMTADRRRRLPYSLVVLSLSRSLPFDLPHPFLLARNSWRRAGFHGRGMLLCWRMDEGPVRGLRSSRGMKNVSSEFGARQTEDLAYGPHASAEASPRGAEVRRRGRSIRIP
jgi:hypothetical protein